MNDLGRMLASSNQSKNETYWFMVDRLRYHTSYTCETLIVGLRESIEFDTPRFLDCGLSPTGLGRSGECGSGVFPFDLLRSALVSSFFFREKNLNILMYLCIQLMYVKY